MKCGEKGQVCHTREKHLRERQKVDNHRVHSGGTDRDRVHLISMKTVGTCENPQHRVGIHIA